MDGGAWGAAVHGVAESQTRLSDFTFTFHFHALVSHVYLSVTPCTVALQASLTMGFSRQEY